MHRQTKPANVSHTGTGADVCIQEAVLINATEVFCSVSHDIIPATRKLTQFVHFLLPPASLWGEAFIGLCVFYPPTDQDAEGEKANEP